MAIKGQNLRIFVAGKCIAASNSCTLHLNAQTQDASTKDSTGDWGESEVTGKSWDVSTDALVTLADPESAQGKSTVDIIALIGTSVQLTFDQTNGTNNRTGMNSAIKKTGNAFVTDVSITAANRQNSTYTVQFTGTGALS